MQLKLSKITLLIFMGLYAHQLISSAQKEIDILESIQCALKVEYASGPNDFIEKLFEVACSKFNEMKDRVEQQVREKIGDQVFYSSIIKSLYKEFHNLYYHKLAELLLQPEAVDLKEYGLKLIEVLKKADMKRLVFCQDPESKEFFVETDGFEQHLRICLNEEFQTPISHQTPESFAPSVFDLGVDQGFGIAARNMRKVYAALDEEAKARFCIDPVLDSKLYQIALKHVGLDKVQNVQGLTAVHQLYAHLHKIRMKLLKDPELNKDIVDSNLVEILQCGFFDLDQIDQDKFCVKVKNIYARICANQVNHVSMSDRKKQLLEGIGSKLRLKYGDDFFPKLYQAVYLKFIAMWSEFSPLQQNFILFEDFGNSVVPYLYDECQVTCERYSGHLGLQKNPKESYQQQFVKLFVSAPAALLECRIDLSSGDARVDIEPLMKIVNENCAKEFASNVQSIVFKSPPKLPTFNVLTALEKKQYLPLLRKNKTKHSLRLYQIALECLRNQDPNGLIAQKYNPEALYAQFCQIKQSLINDPGISDAIIEHAYERVLWLILNNESSEYKNVVANVSDLELYEIIKNFCIKCYNDEHDIKSKKSDKPGQSQQDFTSFMTNVIKTMYLSDKEQDKKNQFLPELCETVVNKIKEQTVGEGVGDFITSKEFGRQIYYLYGTLHYAFYQFKAIKKLDFSDDQFKSAFIKSVVDTPKIKIKFCKNELGQVWMNCEPFVDAVKCFCQKFTETMHASDLVMSDVLRNLPTLQGVALIKYNQAKLSQRSDPQDGTLFQIALRINKYAPGSHFFTGKVAHSNWQKVFINYAKLTNVCDDVLRLCKEREIVKKHIHRVLASIYCNEKYLNWIEFQPYDKMVQTIEEFCMKEEDKLGRITKFDQIVQEEKQEVIEEELKSRNYYDQMGRHSLQQLREMQSLEDDFVQKIKSIETNIALLKIKNRKNSLRDTWKLTVDEMHKTIYLPLAAKVLSILNQNREQKIQERKEIAAKKDAEAQAEALKQYEQAKAEAFKANADSYAHKKQIHETRQLKSIQDRKGVLSTVSIANLHDQIYKPMMATVFSILKKYAHQQTHDRTILEQAVEIEKCKKDNERLQLKIKANQLARKNLAEYVRRRLLPLFKRVDDTLWHRKEARRLDEKKIADLQAKESDKPNNMLGAHNPYAVSVLGELLAPVVPLPVSELQPEGWYYDPNCSCERCYLQAQWLWQQDAIRENSGEPWPYCQVTGEQYDTRFYLYPGQFMPGCQCPDCWYANQGCEYQGQQWELDY